ncbi:MAG TPA: alpha/beta fold hydrolase [Thermomicrobiales bacterium]
MQQQERDLQKVVTLVGGSLAGLVAVLGGAAVGWGAYSALALDHQLPLEPAIAAEQRRFRSETAGEIHYYLAREASGRPLVLVHSINAAASAYEMRPLFDAYRTHRPVYAPDLPGFGFSERSDRDYSPALYTAALADLLTNEVQEEGAVDIVALSLGSEFAALAALALPERIRSLTLISPSGLGRPGGAFSAEERAERAQSSARVLRSFSVPLWSQPFYDLLVSPPSIRYFLKQSFVGEPDAGLVAYDYRTAHQPGARFAPLHFVSGKLFTRDIRPTVYERLTQPVLVIYDEDNFVSFDQLPALLKDHTNWHEARIVPTRGLPQFEQLPATIAALDHFWSAREN